MGYGGVMSKRNNGKTIEVPKRVVDSMVEAYQKWEEFRDELEDFILSSDTGFLKKMRKAKKEDVEGKTRSITELKREL